MPRKPSKHADVSRALNALRRMVRGLRAAAETIERGLGVSAAQLFVLSELARVPDQSVKDLAAVTMTTHSTVSQVVAQLVSKRLVIRTTDPHDARRAVLRMSREGSRLLGKAPRAIQEDLVDGFARLRPTERRALANGLEKWLASSGLSAVRPGMLFERPLLAGTRSRRKTRKSSRSKAAL